MPGSMWEKRPCTALPGPPHSGLQAPSWVSPSLAPANVFELYGGFVLWINVQYLFGRRHPINFALSPSSPSSEAEGVLTHFMAMVAFLILNEPCLQGRLFRLRLEKPARSQVSTQALVMTNAGQHLELLRLSLSKRTGLTQLNGAPGRKP